MGSEEIREYEEELNGLVDEISGGLLGLKKPKLNATVKSERIHELSGRMQRAKTVLQSYKVEMRDLPREQAALYDLRLREIQQRLQTMFTELQAAKEEAERQQVGVRTVDEMSTQEVIQEASKVQDASLNKVKRMQQTVEESRQVGAATAIRLKGQTEQLKNIDTDIMKVKSNLSRADLLLRAFMRKMMTDKLIMGFMLLIFIGIVVIVIYKMVGPDKADEGSAPTSVVSSTRRQLAALDAFHALLKRRHSEES
mmetsp:Transcript_12798/g.32763  ORF Transcript_12798/g.32763 Transcript_12798/m.32763 type:complete len:254 (-) Transcript_12798:270-1031(-)